MEKLLNTLKFNDQGLIPCVFQEASTGKVITLAYMSREALELTLKTGKVHVFRRSHGRVMMKGETSGNVQFVREVRADCENNSLLVLIDMAGPGCHTGRHHCYFNLYDSASDSFREHNQLPFESGGSSPKPPSGE
ncbi:MAG: phosphoribosyl-AMP cyclohydrolase [Armatimonadota bacterium]